MQALDEKIVIISEHHQQQQQNSIKNVKKDKSTSAAAALDMSEANLTTAEQWLLTAAQRFERVRNDDDEEEELELHILVNEIKANYASLKCISEQIDPVLKPTSATRCDQLLEHYNRLLKEVQMRGDLLERTQTMMQKTDMLLIQLEKMRDDLRHASAAMAGELGPLAQQKGVALIEDGVQLCAQWEREPADGAAWRAAVDKRVERLKEAVIDVVRMARDRIAAGKSDKLREMVFSFRLNIGIILWRAIDLTYKEQQLRSLLASQQKLQHFVLAEEQRLDAVHAGICQIRQMVESRMKLGQTLEQLHKLSRELDTSLHFFGTLLKNEDAKNADNETAVEQHQKQLQQMRNLLQQANEYIYRERHQAEKFASLANSLNDTDPGLNIYPALDWSRATLSSHEKELSRLTKLSKQWETERQNWQNLKTSTDGTFKPRITVHLPLEHVVLAGSHLELSARAEGNPEPEIVWLKDGCSIGELTGHRRMGWLNSLATLIIWYREEQTVLESDRFRLAFRGDHCALSCSEARTEDAGLYKVLAVNVHGETMNFCRVCIVPPSPKRNTELLHRQRRSLARRVEPDELVPEIVTVPNDTVLPVTDVPPVIEPQLSSQVVREGQHVNFQVRIRGVPKPGVRWFYNGSPIDGDRQDLVLSKDSENCHVLNIPRVVLGHAGQYTVEAQNKAGRERSSATLNVLLGFEETTTKTTATTTTATTSPTSGFDSPQFGSHWFQQHSHQNNLFGEPTKIEINNDHRQMFDQRSWSRQSFGSSPRGIVLRL
uniref:Ig-like domain-containing protein n=1 Tax=Globodera pallida TaxID=36090 RepID=A0A183CIY6_GLOPA